MACLAMHLAIAQKYCEKHSQEDERVFCEGAIAPDIAPDKVVSHYGIKMPINSVKDMLDSKIDIVACSQDLDMSVPYDRAKYLHLVTDYLFYNYLYDEKLEILPPGELNKSLYNDYDFVTNYIIHNYNISIPEQVAHLVQAKEGVGDFRFFGKKATDKFIDLVSALDMQQTNKQIVANKDSFLSNFLQKMDKNIVQ